MVKLSLKEQVYADTDDCIADLVKQIQRKYKITWEEARDHVNSSLKDMFDPKWKNE